MNLIDKAFETFAPVHAVKRAAARKTLKVLNTGYSDGGASHTKNALKGFTAKSTSPVYDIEANLGTLRSRTRSLYMTSPLSKSAINTIKTNVVGGGLKLKARVDYELIGITEEQANELEAQIEREFTLWADTAQCDALGVNNFYELQALFLLGQLMNGDGLCLRKYERPTFNMPYGLRLQLIEADRLCTPLTTGFPIGGNPSYVEWGVNPDNNNEIYSGVEIDNNGKVVAYHFCNQYPTAQNVGRFLPLEWTRIETYGRETGLRNVLHMFEAERAEQRRGVPVLAPVIEALKQLTRYTDAELMAAVISGMYTVFIRTETPTEMPYDTAIPDEELIEQNENDYQLGNGAVNMLGLNESIQIADPKRPNTAFNPFVDALCKQIGSALEIPKELLLKEFNSSYSASRAALLEAWKMFRERRELLANAFCQPVYEMFLTEAVANGRIKAPTFFTDPLIRRAYCGADWSGPAPGMIDPVKEVNAAILRVQNGFSTREEETIGLTGGNFIKNAKQLKRENELLDEAQIKEPTPIITTGKDGEGDADDE